MVVSFATHSRFSTATRQMVRWVDEVIATGPRRYCSRGTWNPAINLYEDDDCFYVVAELAGVDVDRVELRVEKESLVLVGSRETPRPAKTRGDVRVHHMEIDHGNFCRTVKLPPGADASGTEAAYRNGLLWVRIPKVED